MMTRKRTVASLIGLVLIVSTVVACWAWKTRGPILKEVALDLKAGARARGAEKPFERFLELRYGPMNEPANRQKAFVGFFDPNHVEGMHRLVGYMKPSERQTNIAATAEWLANYRQAMTDMEQQSLADWLRSEEGRANIQRASALYRSRDVRYRSATEPVIRELMTTLAELQQNTPP